MENNINISKFSNLRKDLKHLIYIYLSYQDIQLISQLKNKGVYQFLLSNIAHLKKIILLSFQKYNNSIFYNANTIYEELANKIVNFDTLWELITSPSLLYHIPMAGYKTTGGYEVYDNNYPNIFSFYQKESIYCAKPYSDRNVDIYGFLCSDFFYPSLMTPDKKCYLKNTLHTKFKEFDAVQLNNNYKYTNKLDLYTNNQYKHSDESTIDDSEILNTAWKQDYLFVIHNISLSNSGPVTCPAKTVAIFIMDSNELNHEDEILLNLLDSVNDMTIFQKIIDQNSTFLNPIKKKEHDELVFVEFDTLLQRSFNRNLKLLAYVKMKKFSNVLLCFQHLKHFGKFAIIKLIDQYVIHSYGDDNIDLQTFLLYGAVLKLKP